MESDRLNRVEHNLQTVTDILVAVARRAEATDARLDRLTEAQKRTQSKLDHLRGNVDHSRANVDHLREDIDIAVETIVALSSNTNATLASINAALERQDRVLDYLLRRDLDPPST